jgi:hypothetical protein
MTRAVLLVDLDDTLFQTLRKRPADVPEARLMPMAVARDGSPLAFATPRQLRFLEWLSHDAALIPVTARSLDALRRVHIPFTQAICAHGAVLLGEDGRPDRAWAEEIASAAAVQAATLQALLGRAEALSLAGGHDLQIRVQAEDGVPLYLLLKHPQADEAALSAVTAALRCPHGWLLHRNGNNAAYLPPFLGKQHAVARLLPRLRERCPDAPVIGVGDSLTDASFMALCDYAMTPCGSQLGARLLGGRS